MPMIITGVAIASAISAFGQMMVTLLMPCTGSPVLGSMVWRITFAVNHNILFIIAGRGYGHITDVHIRERQMRRIRVCYTDRPGLTVGL